MPSSRFFKKATHFDMDEYETQKLEENKYTLLIKIIIIILIDGLFYKLLSYFGIQNT